MAKKLTIIEKPQQPKLAVQVVVASIEKKASPIIKKLETIDEIVSQEDFDRAALLVKQLKELDELATEEEKKITTPLNQALTAARAHFKPFHVLVKGKEDTIKLKMSVWYQEQQNKRAKLAEDFDKGKIKKIETFSKKDQQLQVSGSKATATIRKIWTAEVINEKIIPREFLMPDMKKIEQHLREGNEVPGVKWYQKEQFAI